jgi:hypothetical protein
MSPVQGAGKVRLHLMKSTELAGISAKGGVLRPWIEATRSISNESVEVGSDHLIENVYTNSVRTRTELHYNRPSPESIILDGSR